MLINNYEIDKESPMGFGDFIRGCISCHQLSLKNNFKFDINLGPFSDFYKPASNYFPKAKSIHNFRNVGDISALSKKIYFLSGQNYDNINNNTYHIFTNTWPDNTIENIEKPNQKHSHQGWGDISKETKKFIKERLQPVGDINDFFKEFPKEYEVVHIRSGDPNGFKNKFDAKIDVTTSENGIASYVMFQIADILKTTDKPLIILSDSSVVKNYINTISSGFNSDRIIISEVKAIHSGMGGMKETVYDLNILNHAKKIHQLSIYTWGSGFSNIAHHIFDVPIQRYDQIKSHF